MPNLIDPVKVGIKIKELLKKNDMTQEKLANELSISKSAVSQNLSGRSTFDIQNLIKISQLFNITLDELLGVANNNVGELSIYEKLMEKDLSWYQETNSKELNVNSPDIYGKVLVEYIIDQNNLELFKYLDNQQVSFITSHNHRAKDINIKIINYMLENQLNPIKYLKEYLKINLSLKITNRADEEKMWKLIDYNNNLELFKQLLNEYIVVNNYILKINFKKKIPILNLNDAYEIQGKYHLKNFLLYLVEYSKDKKYLNYHKIIKEMIEFDFIEGIIIFNDHYFGSKDFNYPSRLAMNLINTISLVVETKNPKLIKNFIDNHSYLSLNKTLELIINHELYDLASDIISEKHLDINFRTVGQVVLAKQSHQLLKLILNYANKETIDYLLAEAYSDDLISINLLLKANGKFNYENYNNKTFDKVNNIIDDLLGRDK